MRKNKYWRVHEDLIELEIERAKASLPDIVIKKIQYHHDSDKVEIYYEDYPGSSFYEV